MQTAELLDRAAPAVELDVIADVNKHVVVAAEAGATGGGPQKGSNR